MKKRLKKVCAIALSVVLTASMLSLSKVEVETYAADSTPVVTEIPNTVRTQQNEINGSFLSVTGFAKGHVTDRSSYVEGNEAYAVVTNEEEFFEALRGATDDEIKVIEIRSDLYLGWLELSEDIKDSYSSFVSAYEGSESQAGAPLANPSMIESGVSQITINGIDGLTIFSKTGHKFYHAEFKVNAAVNDLVIRNLQFAEVWDWDDQRTTGYGGSGQTGTAKRVGWSYIKINGSKNVWIDHCTFGVAFDGCLDIENGASGISVTWCDFGDIDYSPGSMLYKTIDLLETQYQKNKVDSSVGVFKIYKVMRDNGVSLENIAKYMGYHKKVHLGGGGDSDSWWFSEIGENLLDAPDPSRSNANEHLRMTFAYNNYTNMGSRLPMLRGGVGHLYNCYFDNTALKEARDAFGVNNVQQKIKDIGGSTHFLFRGMDARNGASIAADTNVYYNFDEPNLSSEKNDDVCDGLFGYNHSLIVNSKVTNTRGQEYVGSSWDNNGVNLFNDEDNWVDKSTINNWSWGVEGEKLSYEYQTFPLEGVESNVKTYGGAYAMDMSVAEWLKVDYTTEQALNVVDKNVAVPIEKIELSKTEATLFMDEEFLQLDARVTPSHTTEKASTFTWESSDPTVATVSNSGLVLPLKNGKTTITVKTESGLTATCEVTVSKLVSLLSVTNIPDKIYVGDIIDLDVVMTPDASEVYDDDVIWESSGFRVEVLDGEKGIFKATTSGTNPIQVTSVVNGNRIGSAPTSGRKTITIKKASVLVTGVAVAEEMEVKPGASKALNASVVPANATSKNLLYAVSDCSVAAVDADGNVTGVATGETVITVTSVNGGYSKVCKIKVHANAKDDTQVPSGPVINPENPSGGAVNPENPSGGAVNPENPSGGAVNPENPSGGAVNPENPSGPAINPENPSGPSSNPDDPTEGAVKLGDVDNNGTIELKDAQLALRMALLLESDTTKKQEEAADVDENGTIELKDAQQILRRALLLIEEFEKASKEK